MRNFLVMIVTLVIRSSAFAEPELFVCKSIQTYENEACLPGDIARLQHFLVDTDDFEKEDKYLTWTESDNAEKYKLNTYS